MTSQRRAAQQSQTQFRKDLRQKAEQGDAEAQFALGYMLKYPNGALSCFPDADRKHDAEAVKWLCMSAEQGHPDAQLHLGLMYQRGRGVSQDYVEAVKWQRQAGCTTGKLVSHKVRD